MTRYLFFFEIYRSYERKDSSFKYTNILNNYNFPISSFYQLNNEDFKIELENKLEARELSLKIIGFYQVSIVILGKEFEFFIILFQSNKELDKETYGENMELCIQIIDECPEIIRKNRIFSNIFVSKLINENFINNYYSKVNNNFNELNWRIDYSPNSLPFCVEIPVFYLLNLDHLLNSEIKTFFDHNFPDLLSNLNINTCACNIFYFERLEQNSNFEMNIIEKIHFNLIVAILKYYKILEKIFKQFSEWLNGIENIYQQKYEQKTLNDLERYFKDAKNSIFGLYPHIFIYGIDKIKLKSNNLPIKSPYFQCFNKDSNHFYRIYHNSSELLNEIVQRLVQLKFLKCDVIKSFNRRELENKLINLKRENEFQDILFKILVDLGFKNVKINCGRRGHRENGKDIVFSDINKFKLLEWNAMIVKIGKIHQPEGRILYKYIDDIIKKGSDALDIPYEDEKGYRFKITKVFLATNDEITDDAKRSLRKKIEGSIFFVEKDTLMHLFA